MVWNSTGHKGSVKIFNPAQLEKMQEVASSLYLKGYTLAQIANQLTQDFGRKVAITRVGELMQEARKHWRTNLNASIAEMQARELAKLDQLEVACWEGYERSLGNHVVTNVKTSEIRLKVPRDINKPVAFTVPTEFKRVAKKGQGNPAGQSTLVKPDNRVASNVVQMFPVPADKKETSVTTELLNGDPRFLALIGDVVHQRRDMLGIDAPKKFEIINKQVEQMTDDELISAVQNVNGLLNVPKAIDISATDVTPSRYGAN
jgi:hypothetical protein